MGGGNARKRMEMKMAGGRPPAVLVRERHAT